MRRAIRTRADAESYLKRHSRKVDNRYQKLVAKGASHEQPMAYATTGKRARRALRLAS